MYAFDIEVYKNWIYVMFKNITDDEIVSCEIKGSDSIIKDEDRSRIIKFLSNSTIFGYNSNNYDVPILNCILNNLSVGTIYNISNSIIKDKVYEKEIYENYEVTPVPMNHFDLEGASPSVRTPLKLYAARMHFPKLENLPIHHEAEITPKTAEIVKKYCENDIDVTISLYNELKPRIDLRETMGKRYLCDLRSKSDVQIAELILKMGLERNRPKPMELKEREFSYTPPTYIKFTSPACIELFNLIKDEKFKVTSDGKVVLPESISKTSLLIGDTNYKIGIGGIHSQEKSRTIESKEGWIISDQDVASYYPSIILKCEFYPKNLGREFLNVYHKIVTNRLIAKQEGNLDYSNFLKIVINGTYGKLGSPYSFLFDPEMLIHTTLTGQLSLLMLIEQLEESYISVVSANTDGIVSYFHERQEDLYYTISGKWQCTTKFKLEESRYLSLYSRDVSNYLAVKVDNTYKGKGIFAPDGLVKNPQASITTRAVIEYIINGIPIEKTIKSSRDVREFIYVRQVKGGAIYKDVELGKIVRWIYVRNGGEPIRYTLDERKVAKSDGCEPIMDIVSFPDNLDYEKYVNESLDILESIGYPIHNDSKLSKLVKQPCLL